MRELPILSRHKRTSNADSLNPHSRTVHIAIGDPALSRELAACFNEYAPSATGALWRLSYRAPRKSRIPMIATEIALSPFGLVVLIPKNRTAHNMLRLIIT